MAKKAEAYGLPTLTFSSAARVLGVDEADFIRWVLTEIKPSPSRWSEWTKPEDAKGWQPLPERLIRLYLMKQRGEPALAVASPPHGGISTSPKPATRKVQGRRALRRPKKARG